MDRAIKQRILGTLVLLAGSAVLAPLVLDGSGTMLPHEVALPPRPVVVPPPMPPAAWPLPTVAAPTPVTQDATPASSSADTPVAKVSVSVPQAEATPPAVETAPVAQMTVKTVAVMKPTTGINEQHQEKSSENGHTAPALPDAWTVQVASLASVDAARALRSELLRRGYPVYQRQLGSAYKVFVGPELDKAKAESFKERLAKDGFAGWMQAYSVH